MDSTYELIANYPTRSSLNPEDVFVEQYMKDPGGPRALGRASARGRLCPIFPSLQWELWGFGSLIASPQSS
jgi:hypothetical protein